MIAYNTGSNPIEIGDLNDDEGHTYVKVKGHKEWTKVYISQTIKVLITMCQGL